MKTTRLMALMVVVVGGLAGPRAAQACSCVELGAACEGYWKAAAVFRGRVDSIARVAVKPPSRMPAGRRVTLTVLEPFSGVAARTVVVTTGSAGGDCGFPFREGAEYIVYANRSDPGAPLSAGICSRTREVSQAGEDLTYARSVASGTAVTSRISGDIMLASRSLSRVAAPAPVRQPSPLPDVAIRLERDGQTTRVLSGADGRFVVEGLGAGRYRASIDLPEGFYAEGWPRTIELADARSCVEVHATAFADGQVVGRVIDGAGRPVAGLTIELTAPAGLDDPLGPERLRDLTDSEGHFTITHIPAGRFVVGINTQRGPDGGTLEPRVFHPGVLALPGATRVTLKAGERVELRDFVLPREAVFVAVTGLVIDQEGVPVAGARVYLKGQADADYILSEPAVTDGSGRFTLAAVAGRGYRVFAERVRGDGANARIDSSEQQALTAAVNSAPLKLTLRARY